MESQQVKQLGYLAFAAGVASVVGSAAIYMMGQRGQVEGRRNTGVFVGLWAPTFFAIAEMLDRIAEQDHSYMGVPIHHDVRERVPLGMR